MRKSVSPNFREYVLRKYPALVGNPAYLRFFRYLCFGDFFDKKSSQLVVPTKMLAEECCLKTWDRNFNGKDFLVAFKSQVLPDLTWVEHKAFPTDSWLGKARQVESLGFDAEMLSALHQECISPSDKLVDFVTGEQVGSSSIYAERRQETEHYEAELAQRSLNPTQTKMINYLRRIKAGSLFLPRISLNADKIKNAIGTLSPVVQQMQYQTLANIQRNPNVYYLPSERGHTCRLSPTGDSVLGLKSEVRKAVCSGLVDCDLRSSQFSILAAKLNAPRSQELIASGASLWKSFYRHTHGVDGEPPAKIKKVFKEGIYSLCFGKSTPNLANMLNDHKLAGLLSHPVFRELLQLREGWFKEIKKAGGAADVWGAWQALDLTKDPATNKSHRWEGAIAASVIQSVEMEIIAPIFDVAIKHGSAQQFGICLFQHDGACISFQSKNKQPKAEALLKEAVEARAQQLGVATVLEFKPL